MKVELATVVLTHNNEQIIGECLVINKEVTGRAEMQDRVAASHQTIHGLRIGRCIIRAASSSPTIL